MRVEWKKRWVQALRSGEYLQGNGSLKKKDENGVAVYCCLGVLCDIVDPKAWGLLDSESTKFRNQLEGVLPISIMKDVGLDSLNPVIGPEKMHCARANDDDKKTFIEIADLIEKNIQED